MTSPTWDPLWSAGRNLWRNPWFACTVASILGIGLAAVVLIGTTTYQLFVESLPYPGSERIGTVWRTTPESEVLIAPSRADIALWRNSQVIEQVEHVASTELTLVSGAQSEILSGARISVGYASMLGISPTAGRLFLPSDTLPGAEHVALVSERFWQRQYSRSLEALGTTIRLDDQILVIVGVIPGDFDRYLTFSEARDVWLPDGASAMPSARGVPGTVIVRTRKGVAGYIVERELQRLLTGHASSSATGGRPNSITIVHPREVATRRVRGHLLITGVTALLLLIVSVSTVINLSLVRQHARAHMQALRLALGAHPFRLRVEVVLECVMLALVGAIIGVVCSNIASGILRAAAPANLTAFALAPLDLTEIAAVATLSVLIGVVVGLSTALRMREKSLSNALRIGASGLSHSMTSSKLRAIVLTASVMLTIAIAHGAGSLVWHVHELREGSLNFPSSAGYSVELVLPRSRYPSSTDRARFVRQILENLQSDRAFHGVATATHAPPDFGLKLGDLILDGQDPTAMFLPKEVASNSVSSNYFRSMGVRLLAGRDFAENEAESRVVIINEDMARRFWPGGTAIGARVRQSGPDSEWYTVIGVVADVARGGLAPADFRNFQLYFPLESVSRRIFLLLRADGTLQDVAGRVREHVSNVDPLLAVSEVVPFVELVERDLARERFAMAILSILGSVAVVLSTIGMYSVVAFATSQRRKEFAIRLALGGTAGSVQQIVLAQSLKAVSLGVLLGMLAAVSLQRIIAWQLPGVPTGSVSSYLGVASFFTVVALVAAWAPARRSALLSPTMVLSGENQ